MATNFNIKPARKDSKKTIAKIFIGILNVVFALGFIMFLISAAVFSWYAADGPSFVPEKRPMWVLAMLPFFCFGLVMISCAIVDLIMAIKLKRNPYDEKSWNIRQTGKNILLISFKVFVCLSVVELLCLLGLYS